MPSTSTRLLPATAAAVGSAVTNFGVRLVVVVGPLRPGRDGNCWATSLEMVG